MSNAGFYFYNYEEFEAELDYLLDHPSVYAQMCENGKNYVRDRYQWDHIIRQLAGLIDAETAQTAGRESEDPERRFFFRNAKMRIRSQDLFLEILR